MYYKGMHITSIHPTSHGNKGIIFLGNNADNGHHPRLSFFKSMNQVGCITVISGIMALVLGQGQKIEKTFVHISYRGPKDRHLWPA